MTVSAFSVYLTMGPTAVHALDDGCPGDGGDGSSFCQYALYGCAANCGDPSDIKAFDCTWLGGDENTGVTCCECYT